MYLMSVVTSLNLKSRRYLFTNNITNVKFVVVFVWRILQPL